MHPNAMGLVLVGSLAGGVLGPLTVWNRRLRVEEQRAVRRCFVLLTGSAAAAVAAIAFAKAFGPGHAAFAAAITLLIGGWSGVVHSALPLKTPSLFSRVTQAEMRLLGRRWTGVPLFGRLLRNTPLRHLGGPVYLERATRDFAPVLRWIGENEAIHEWAVLFCAPLLAYWAACQWWGALGSSGTVHLLLNAYPVLHLRLARGRIEALQTKLKKRGHLRP